MGLAEERVENSPVFDPRSRVIKLVCREKLISPRLNNINTCRRHPFE